MTDTPPPTPPHTPPQSPGATDPGASARPAPTRTPSTFRTAAGLGLALGIALGIAGTWLVLRDDDPPQDAAAALNSAPAGAPADAGPPPANVVAGVAQMVPTRPTTALVGRLQPVRLVTLAAEATGRILRLPVEEGTPVVADETVVAEVEAVWSQLAAQQAAARRDAASASVANAQLEADRLAELQRTGSAVQREYDNAATALLRAQADLAEAEATLALADQETQRLAVRAPFDGTVIQTLAEVGQWVTRGDEVATIVSRGEIDAVIDVPEAHINHLTLGDTIPVRVDALDRFVQGTVAAINPAGNNAARTYPVHLRFPDEDAAFKPGMSVTVALPTGPPGAGLLVPADAVNFSPEGTRVWVALTTDPTAPPIGLPVFVRVHHETPDGFIVEPLTVTPDERVPLYPDARVVVQGQERIFFPGMPLNIVNADALDTQPASTPRPQGGGGAERSEAEGAGRPVSTDTPPDVRPTSDA